MLAPNGSVLASAGVDSQVGSELQTSRAVKLVMHGAPYALGDLVGTGKAGVIYIALALTTPYGRRVLVEGFAPVVCSQPSDGELERIPGVAGAQNLIVDANYTVVASTCTRPAATASLAPSAPRSVVPRVIATAATTRGGADSTWRLVLSSPTALFRERQRAGTDGFRG